MADPGSGANPMRCCPTSDELLRMLDRPSGSDPEIAEHLQDCTSCQAALDALTVDASVVPEAGRAAVDLGRFMLPPGFLDRLFVTPPPELALHLGVAPPADPLPLPSIPGYTIRREIG